VSEAREVAVIVGSLRKESLNRKLAHALMRLAAPKLAMKLAEIGDLPLYNQDHDASPPASWARLRETIRAADAVLFVTPEYNRSVPGVLKNAIDVASRPYGHNAWNGKPGAIVSSSPGAMGGFGANHHLRQSLVFVNVPAMAQPEAYVGHAGELFDERGDIKNETTREFLTAFLAAFGAWIENNRPRG
jgi:chromate reductase